MFSGGNHFLLNITAGVKGQTGAVRGRALRKCQPTLLHVNHLQQLQFAVQCVGSTDLVSKTKTSYIQMLILFPPMLIGLLKQCRVYSQGSVSVRLVIKVKVKSCLF